MSPTQPRNKSANFLSFFFLFPLVASCRSASSSFRLLQSLRLHRQRRRKGEKRGEITETPVPALLPLSSFPLSLSSPAGSQSPPMNTNPERRENLHSHTDCTTHTPSLPHLLLSMRLCHLETASSSSFPFPFSAATDNYLFMVAATEVALLFPSLLPSKVYYTHGPLPFLPSSPMTTEMRRGDGEGGEGARIPFSKVNIQGGLLFPHLRPHSRKEREEGANPGGGK